MPRATPSFAKRKAASATASKAARGSSRKTDTRCELTLRRALWERGLRYRVNQAGLPGCPDIVFVRRRIVIFCDGDFWHGRNLEARLVKLGAGHNAPYWVAKIKTNVERDKRNDAKLRADGWIVFHFWEGDINSDVETIAASIEMLVRSAG